MTAFVIVRQNYSRFDVDKIQNIKMWTKSINYFFQRK